MLRFLEALRVRNFSPATIEGRENYLAIFLEWCQARELRTPAEITRPVLQRYQRHVFQLRKPDGQPLSFRGQYNRLVPVRVFFRWLARENVLLSNPASELEMPRMERRLPRCVFSAEEVEAVMARPNVGTNLGLRDRAILEVFYSTGIRRSEMVRLELTDLDESRGTLMVRQGKGRKDRLIPVGERAVAWTRRYLEEVRPGLVRESDPRALFLSEHGQVLTADRLTQMVTGYVEAAELGKHGSCHALRHACATLMLEGGADIRYVQEMLGHATLATTEIYTHVAIAKLKAVHTATHPGANLERSAGPSELEDEDPRAVFGPGDPEPP
jgi:integrase/recombinase XerD